MANVVLTRVCNGRCEYCFAQPIMAAPDRDTPFMSAVVFHRLLDLVRKSGGQEIRLLGGEPTLHPEFPELLESALARGLRLLVFSNGLMPGAAIDALAAIPPDLCRVVLNIEAGQGTPGSLRKRKIEVLRRLGDRIVLGYNIYRLPLDLSPLMKIWNDSRWTLAPFIRLGISHPIHKGTNTCLHTKDYFYVGECISRFATQCTPVGVSLQFDCGFVRCMFDETGIEALRENQAGAVFHCRPIVDIGPRERAVHCFALADEFRLDVTDVSTVQGLRDGFSEMTKAYRPVGVYRACSVCPQKREGNCDGGCLSHRMARLQVPLTANVGGMGHE